MSTVAEQIWQRLGSQAGCASQREWLETLQAHWQIVADLSFADLVLWLVDDAARGYWALAHVRPATGPTALVDDIAGTFTPWGQRPSWDEARLGGHIVRAGDPQWRDQVTVQIEAIPLTYAGRVVAVVAREANLQGFRMPSRLELSYLGAARDLIQMIADGTFPDSGWVAADAEISRVGDGYVRLDAAGTVTYISPNAHSLCRRIGISSEVTGNNFAQLLHTHEVQVLSGAGAQADAVIAGRSSGSVELVTPSAIVAGRALALRPQQRHTGAVVLLSDVTELRHREQQLVTKDVMIKEIHHRVKNNLQTVASLLRLQVRRLPAGQSQAALLEAVRRVNAIAVVHERLSQVATGAVDFDGIADELLRGVSELNAGIPDGGFADRVPVVRYGSWGGVPAELATPMALVLTELVHNAIEHAYPDGGAGQVVVELAEAGLGEVPGWKLAVIDNGIGIDADPIEENATLGLTIVRTLTSEVGGRFSLSANPGGGTCASVWVPSPTAEGG